MTTVIDTLIINHSNEIRIQKSRNALSGSAQKLPGKLRLKTIMDIGPMTIIESLCIKSVIKTIYQCIHAQVLRYNTNNSVIIHLTFLNSSLLQFVDHS